MTVDGQKREIGERKGGIIRKTGERWKKGAGAERTTSDP